MQLFVVSHKAHPDFRLIHASISVQIPQIKIYIIKGCKLCVCVCVGVCVGGVYVCVCVCYFLFCIIQYTEA